jgi:hypothetical protein
MTYVAEGRMGFEVFDMERLNVSKSQDRWGLSESS